MTETAPTIPGYRTTRLLGRGATARVYLARDAEGRRVALKVLLSPDELAENPAAAEMFANEVRMTLQLRHRHLVRGYAGQPFGEGAYLALEYFPEGGLHEQLIPGHPLPLEQSYRLLQGVAAGLAYMHGAGAVHQDVKPQNIYLDGERAVLADFGAAFMAGQGGKAGGSPFYMAPEIYRGESGSPASDVYSFGVLCYELLTGKRPFVGESYDELMGSHLNAMPPSLAHLNPQVPRALAQLAQKALAKNAADRPGMTELAAALSQVLGDPAEPEAPAAAPVPACTESGVRLGRGAPVSSETGLPGSGLPGSGLPASRLPGSGLPGSGFSGPGAAGSPDAGAAADSGDGGAAEAASGMTAKAGQLISKLNPFAKRKS